MSDAVTILLYLQIAVLAVCAYLFGEFAQRLRVPMVVGELFVGVIIGPTILKRVFPYGYQLLAPNGISHPHLTAIGSLAIALLLFSAGTEFDMKMTRQAFRPAWKIALGALVIPFLFGFVPALIWPDFMGRQTGISALLFAIFVGTVFSVTALSMLVRVLMDLNIFKTPFGMMTVTAAVIDNVVTWTLAGVVFGIAAIESGGGVIRPSPAITLGGSLLFIALSFTVGRFILSFILKWLGAFCKDTGSLTGIIIGMGLLAAGFSRAIGLDSLFGSFIAGCVVGSCNLKDETRQAIRNFVFHFLAPIYFAVLGMKVDFITNFHWGLVLAVLTLSCAGKMLGCALAARQEKLPNSVSLPASLLMNSRGAMALILAVMGLEAHLVHERFFVAVAVMSVITCALSGLGFTSNAKLLASSDWLPAEGA